VGDVYIFIIGLMITLMVSASFVLLMYGAADKTPPYLPREKSSAGQSSETNPSNP